MPDQCCVICGKTVTGRRRKYCSAACAAAGSRARDRAGKNHEKHPPYNTKQCPDCGATFCGPIKSYRCPDCQRLADQQHEADHKARKRQGKTRLIGSTDLCSACGAEYTVMSGAQKYCPSCRAQATRSAINEHKRLYMQDARFDPEKRSAINESKRRLPAEKICKQCGKPFSGLGTSIYCSSVCRAAALKAYYAAYDLKRRESQREKSRQRNKTLTMEERAEINRKARENYAKRKARKEDES